MKGLKTNLMRRDQDGRTMYIPNTTDLIKCENEKRIY